MGAKAPSFPHSPLGSTASSGRRRHIVLHYSLCTMYCTAHFSYTTLCVLCTQGLARRVARDAKCERTYQITFSFSFLLLLCMHQLSNQISDAKCEKTHEYSVNKRRIRLHSPSLWKTSSCTQRPQQWSIWARVSRQWEQGARNHLHTSSVRESSPHLYCEGTILIPSYTFCEKIFFLILIQISQVFLICFFPIINLKGTKCLEASQLLIQHCTKKVSTGPAVQCSRVQYSAVK